MSASEAWVLVCRAGYERALCEEVSWNIHSRRPVEGAQRHAASGPAHRTPPQGAHAALSCEPKADGGWVVLSAPPALGQASYVFERQRLPRARWDAAGPTLLASLLAAWEGPLAGPPAEPPRPWTLHAYSPNPDTEESLSGAARGLGEALLRALGERHPPLARSHVEPEDAARPRGAPRPPPHASSPHVPPRPAALSPAAHGPLRVLQLCRVEGGVWSSLATLAELSDPWPGGVHRMPEDPAAPSRSYLKLEEALDVMGSQPQPGERVVDLGAAPGGWSWAFVKRGCSVIAVDNGPVKLASLGDWGGELTHVREDGLRFRPERAVDWLASDMLIAPGQALGLLRKWHAAGWARRYVVNFKLPQREPWAALAPLCAALDALPGFRYRLRHLYHDRREVTLMGESTLASGAAGGLPRGSSGAARTRPRGTSGAAKTQPRGTGPVRSSGSRRAAGPAARGNPPPGRPADRPAAPPHAGRGRGNAAPGGRTNHPRRRGRHPGGRRG